MGYLNSLICYVFTTRILREAKRDVDLIQWVKFKNLSFILNRKYQYEQAWKQVINLEAMGICRAKIIVWNFITSEKKPVSLKELLIPGVGQKSVYDNSGIS